MRIGEAAKALNISIDTIRYYMELGMVIPIKNGSQFDFSNREMEILRLILDLKKLHFDLKTIQALLIYRRTENWGDSESMRFFSSLLKQKDEALQEEIADLQRTRSALLNIMENCQVHQKEQKHFGVPLRALSLLSCPNCHTPLSITDASFFNNTIQCGNISCPNGDYHAEIRDGILVTGNRYEGKYDSPDLERNLYRTMTGEQTRMYQISADTMLRELSGMNLSGKVIAENFINSLYLLFNHYNEMPEDCLFIVIDKYEEVLRMYKDKLAALGIERDIFFIADASKNYPLKQGSVDLMLDYFCVNENDIYFTSRYYDSMEPYFKANTTVLGTMMVLPKNAKSRKRYHERYPEGSLECMDFSVTEQDLQKHGFRVSSKLIVSARDTQKQFSFACLEEGEQLDCIYYKAKRK